MSESSFSDQRVNFVETLWMPRDKNQTRKRSNPGLIKMLKGIKNPFFLRLVRHESRLRRS